MIKYFVIAIAILGLVWTGSAAQAETCTFDPPGGTTGDWTETDNWSCGHEPGFDDLALIASGNTCNMDDATGQADSVLVSNTATLNIQSGNMLSLDGDDDDSSIIGTVNLQGSGSELSFEENSQTIDGAGSIVGQHNLAKISIESGDTLTNDTRIEGHLKIVGLGDFVNTGTVHANTGGALSIDCASFEDDATALWKVSTSSSAILRFNVTSPSSVTLDGDFELDDGNLDVDSKGFQTNGSLDWTGGTIGVAQGSAITFG